jgi:hypothetical protein
MTAMKTKIYSRFTFTNLKNAESDSFDFFFALKFDNLFLDVSPDGLTDRKPDSQAPPSLLSSPSRNSGMQILGSIILNPLLTLITLGIHGPRSSTAGHDHLLMSKIRHLTIPFWTLDAEFNSPKESDYRWQGDLVFTIARNFS